MAYTLNTANFQITVNDGGVDQDSTSINLLGLNYDGYGELQNQNFVDILENFARSNGLPPNPVEGQIWYDKSIGRLRYFYDDAGSNASIGVIVGSTQPTEVRDGDLWWDGSKLKAFNGNSNVFIDVGPFSAQFGSTGTEIISVAVQGGGSREVVAIIRSGNLVAIINDGSAFTVSTADTVRSSSGFVNLQTGFNPRPDIANFTFAGQSTQVSSNITFNNSGNGAASGTSFNGSAARTISFNTIGAQPLLVSGTNIKTINGETILGSGNIVIAGGGGGSIDSVTATGSTSGLTLTSNTVSGEVTVTLSGSIVPSGFGNQSANRILAGPGSGTSSTPTFRELVSADLPETITSNTSGKSGSVNNTRNNGELTMWSGSQSQYDAIGTKSATTVYFITG